MYFPIYLLISAVTFSEGFNKFAHNPRSMNNMSRRDLWNPFSGPEITGVDIIDAVATRNQETVKALLQKETKENINKRDKEGNNALHIIAKQGHYKVPPESNDSIPNMVINAGMDMNAKNGIMRTPLEIALLSGWQRIAILLLDRGANMEAVENEVLYI